MHYTCYFGGVLLSLGGRRLLLDFGGPLRGRSGGPVLLMSEVPLDRGLDGVDEVEEVEEACRKACLRSSMVYSM